MKFISGCEDKTDSNCIIEISEKCGPHFFQCLSGVCIMKRYVCDGLPDCKSGEDESRDECGKYVILKEISYCYMIDCRQVWIGNWIY
jgi:hypothetical protein